MNRNEFRCAMCKEVYKRGWSKKQAEAEAIKYFGKATREWKDTPVFVCDDCFKKVHPKDHPDLVAKAKIEL